MISVLYTMYVCMCANVSVNYVSVNYVDRVIWIELCGSSPSRRLSLLEYTLRRSIGRARPRIYEQVALKIAEGQLAEVLSVPPP